MREFGNLVNLGQFVPNGLGLLKKDEPAIWIDHEGIEWRTPTGKKLHMARYPLHAHLRAFVYRRDKFCCGRCGARAVGIVDPENFDGRNTPEVDRKNKRGWYTYLVIDHVISRRNGGSNHPLNLQTLCDSCNCAKAGLVDAKRNKNGAY